MPRTKGSVNKLSYHYKVKIYDGDNHDELIEEAYFQSQRQIAERFSMNRTAIYMNIHTDSLSKKFGHIEIEKLTPPMPVYQNSKINYAMFSEYCEMCESNECSCIGQLMIDC